MSRSSQRTVVPSSFHRRVLCALALGCIASAASAQDTTSVRQGWIIGPMLGVPGFSSAPTTEPFTVAVVASRLAPDQASVDLELGVVPRGFSDGLIPLQARLGFGLPFSVNDNVFLLPSAGLSAFGAFGTGHGGGTNVGFYAGMATLIVTGSAGFRAGVSWERFSSASAGFWLLELGLMHVPLPTARHATSP